MRQAAIGFKSKGLTLEGIFATPQEIPEPYPAILVCHPHPMLGGSMNNSLIVAICRAADERGFASLRFNFRGVGESEGKFSNGDGEQDDTRAALDALRQWPGVDARRLAMAGYSFGAGVILDGLKKYRAARCLAFIAPPVSAVQRSAIAQDKRPKLFITGQNDRISPSTELQRALDDVRQPVQFVEVPGADHSLIGHALEVAGLVMDFVAESLPG